MSKLLPASVVFVAVVIIVVDDVTKETVGSPVTTNCIVTRKLRDYGTRVNHRETVHVRVAAVARAREKGETEQALGKGGGRTKRGRGGAEGARDRDTEDENEDKRERGWGWEGRKQLKQLLFILSDCSSHGSRELKLLASLNFHCSRLVRCHFAPCTLCTSLRASSTNGKYPREVVFKRGISYEPTGKSFETGSKRVPSTKR